MTASEIAEAVKRDELTALRQRVKRLEDAIEAVRDKLRKSFDDWDAMPPVVLADLSDDLERALKP